MLDITSNTGYALTDVAEVVPPAHQMSDDEVGSLLRSIDEVIEEFSSGKEQGHHSHRPATSTSVSNPSSPLSSSSGLPISMHSGLATPVFLIGSDLGVAPIGIAPVMAVVSQAGVINATRFLDAFTNIVSPEHR